MRVFEHDQSRCLPAEGGCHGKQRRKRPLPEFGRRHLERRIAVGGRDGEQRREGGRDLVARQSRPFDQLLQPVEPIGGWLAADKASSVPDLADHGMEGIVEMVRRALIAHDDVALVVEALPQRRQNARFADAGLAREQDDLTFAASSLLPAFKQECDLVRASDQRRECLGARCVEAAEILPLADHALGGDRRAEALQRLRGERFDLESLAEQPAGRFRNQDRAGFSLRPQPSSCARG